MGRVGLALGIVCVTGWMIATLVAAPPAARPAGKAPAASTSKNPPAHTSAPRSLKRMSAANRLSPDGVRALAAASGTRGVLAASGVVERGPARYVVQYVEFKDADSCNQFKVEGATVYNRFDRFADVFIVADNNAMKVLAAIRATPGYVWDEFASNVYAPPPIVGPKGTSRATPEAIVHGGVGDLKGKGVIIAVLDSGLDFRNPDFVTFDADGQPTSRLRYFWDTMSDSGTALGLGGQAPVSYPNGASVGTLYSRDDLNRELRSIKPLISTWDVDGHGTACAGVAASNGNNSNGRYQGVAPEAEIIGVRLGDNLESAYLLNAICAWLDKVAGETPLVISCSFGGRMGGHDGMRIEERQLNARFPMSIQGRALCIAAGNDGGSPRHADLIFGSKDQAGEIRWTMNTPGLLEVYYDVSDEKDLRYVAVGADLVESGEINPLTGKYVSYFDLKPGAAALRYYTESGKQVVADAYLHEYGSGGARFDDSCVSYSKLIESPGSSHHAITVGSYDWNDQFEQHGQLGAFTDPLKGAPLTIGSLSGYSSTGPLRNSDVVKPDIVAPGQYYAASASRNTRATLDTTGRYGLFNGTSAATPYTSGVLALIMQKKPSITLGEIKELFKQHATRDRFTGVVPNAKWGYGKLDLKAVEKMLKAVE